MDQTSEEYMNACPSHKPDARRKVLDCASPLALATTHEFQSARGLAQSKTLTRGLGNP